MLCKKLFYFYILINVLCNCNILPKFKIFIKNKIIYNKFTNLINNNNKNRPIILEGNNIFFKKDFCKILAHINNLNFIEYNLNEFVLDLPHKKYNGNVIYVSYKEMNNYEKEIICNIMETHNLIILDTEKIDKNNILRNDIKKIKFPKLNKFDIQNYIYDCITYYKYNKELYLLNWLNYDIDKLDIEKINLLLYQLNMVQYENKMFNIIHNNMNNIIYSLLDI